VSDLPDPGAPAVLYVGDESECLAGFCAEAGGGLGAPVVVETAADGLEAMNWLKENRSRDVAVIVLDFALPVLEAFGFLKGLRAEADLAGIPVVLISPRATDPRIGKLGVAAALERPVDLRQLVDAVRGFLSVS
jgi:DNA-binding response OmpR family regulator